MSALDYDYDTVLEFVPFSYIFIPTHPRVV